MSNKLRKAAAVRPMDDRTASIRCSLIIGEFIPTTDRPELAAELDAVRDELHKIERAAGDPHTALVKMRAHLEKRHCPRWDTIRKANGLDTTLCQSVLELTA